MPTSRHLKNSHFKALEKIGDILIPGEDNSGHSSLINERSTAADAACRSINKLLVSFSQSGCLNQIDRVLDYMPTADLKDLKLLLQIFSFLPTPLIRLFLYLLEWNPPLLGAPLGGLRLGPVGAILRFIRIGLRGLIMTLYFDDENVKRALEFEVDVYTGDLKET